MAQEDVLVKAVAGLLTSQQELANSTRAEFDQQAKQMDQLSDQMKQMANQMGQMANQMRYTTGEMRSSAGRINEKMEQHTKNFENTLEVMKSFADTSADTRGRITKLEADVEELRARLDDMEEAS